MRIGVFYFPTDDGINVTELARALEDRGFESLFVPEHTHIPVSRRTPFPGGGELPRHYKRTHDPFIALSFAAAATRKLVIGTGVCLVPQHEPIALAKTIASLDLLSGGRFEFGIGGGWNVDEMENHGVRYETRFKQMGEYVKAMKAIWTQEEASFHGDMVKFDPIWSWPKPARVPPILLGGESDHTLRRVVDYCDGWFPRGYRGFDPQQARERLDRMAQSRGRDPSTLSIHIFGARPDAATLENYARFGFQRTLLGVPNESRDEILRTLDKWAPLTAGRQAA